MGVETAQEFGEELRRERELREVTRDQLAVATKVSVRQIESLETGRLQHLPASVFARGFVRSIAEHLGLDADRTVAAFRNVYDNWEIEARTKAAIEPTTAGLRLSRPRRAVSSDTTVKGLGIALLLASFTGGAAFLKSRTGEPRRAVPAASTAAARPDTGPASLALPPAIAAATVALPSQGARPASFPGERGSTLTLSFKADCWTEVLIDGKVAVKGVFEKGSIREFSGGRTFTLTLGNASVVEVALDGQALQPHAAEGDVVTNWVIGAQG